MWRRVWIRHVKLNPHFVAQLKSSCKWATAHLIHQLQGVMTRGRLCVTITTRGQSLEIACGCTQVAAFSPWKEMSPLKDSHFLVSYCVESVDNLRKQRIHNPPPPSFMEHISVSISMMVGVFQLRAAQCRGRRYTHAHTHTLYSTLSTNILHLVKFILDCFPFAHPRVMCTENYNSESHPKSALSKALYQAPYSLFLKTCRRVHQCANEATSTCGQVFLYGLKSLT